MSQQINLFNPIFLKQKKTFSALNMIEALGLLLLGVVVFYGFASYETAKLTKQAEETTRQYNQARLRLAQTSARYAPKKVDAALETEVTNVQAQLVARKAALNSLGIGANAQDAGYAEYMRALARQSLTGLWLTGLKIAKGGTEIEIVGRALQPELVPSYIRGLNREHAMQGRAIESLVMSQRQDVMQSDASRPAGVSDSYTYTEFRLGSSHGELPAEGAAAQTARAAAGLTREASQGSQPSPAQAAGAASK